MKHIHTFESFINENLNEEVINLGGLKYAFNPSSPDRKVGNYTSPGEKFFNSVTIMGKFEDTRHFKDGASASSLKDGDYVVYPLLYNGDGNQCGTTSIYKPLALKVAGGAMTLDGVDVNPKVMDKEIENSNTKPIMTKKAQGPGFKYDKEWHFLLALEK